MVGQLAVRPGRVSGHAGWILSESGHLDDSGQNPFSTPVSWMLTVAWAFLDRKTTGVYIDREAILMD
jgi:hypothetical protein